MKTDAEKLTAAHVEIERLQSLLRASESLKRGYLDEVQQLHAALKMARQWMPREPVGPMSAEAIIAVEAALSSQEGQKP